jgi:hypothetical protein
MSGPPDYFTDLVLEGEPLLATLAGAGADGKSWIQLGVTPFRMVAVKLVQNESGEYKPALRQVLQKDQVRIRRFPRSQASQARIEFWGFQKDPLVVVDVDDPTIFPSVEPFLEAWGGFVDGTPSFTRSRDPNQPIVRSVQLKWVVAGVFGLAVFSCGCLSALAVAVRYLVQP